MTLQEKARTFVEIVHPLGNAINRDAVCRTVTAFAAAQLKEQYAEFKTVIDLLRPEILCEEGSDGACDTCKKFWDAVAALEIKYGRK